MDSHHILCIIVRFNKSTKIRWSGVCVPSGVIPLGYTCCQARIVQEINIHIKLVFTHTRKQLSKEAEHFFIAVRRCALIYSWNAPNIIQISPIFFYVFRLWYHRMFNIFQIVSIWFLSDVHMTGLLAFHFFPLNEYLYFVIYSKNQNNVIYDVKMSISPLAIFYNVCLAFNNPTSIRDYERAAKSWNRWGSM